MRYHYILGYYTSLYTTITTLYRVLLLLGQLCTVDTTPANISST